MMDPEAQHKAQAPFMVHSQRMEVADRKMQETRDELQDIIKKLEVAMPRGDPVSALSTACVAQMLTWTVADGRR